MRDFLECQAFVVHLRNEHRQIHQAIRDIERELDSVDLPSEQSRICDSFRRLRATLVEHFKEEEQGGCLEEAVSCVPRLSSEVAEIEKEHASILELIDHLIKRSGERLTNDFRESFRQFTTILHAHETAENRILHTAFGTGEFETEASKSAYGE